MSDNRENPRSTTEVDKQIGRRVRTARQLKHLSQEQLGKMLGVSYQQVQKYERGASRLPSGRLWSIARVLDLPVSFFYPSASDRAFDTLLTELDLPSGMNAAQAAKILQSLADAKPAVRASLINMIGAIDGQKEGH